MNQLARQVVENAETSFEAAKEMGQVSEASRAGIDFLVTRFPAPGGAPNLGDVLREELDAAEGVTPDAGESSR